MKHLIRSGIVIALFAITSCSKQQMEKPKAGGSTPTVSPLVNEGGVLKFKDKETFNKTIQDLQQKD